MTPFTLAHLTLGAPPAESIAAASAAGFQALGLRIAPRRPGEPYPVRVIGEPETIRAIRRQASDAGVAISNVQAYQFFPDTRWEDMQSLVATAHALGAPLILAYSFDPDEERFLELFTRYCDEARAAGILIALEFLPYSRIRNLSQALHVIDRCGAANARVVIDVLHLYRSGGTARDVAHVDPDVIALVQLCDAQRPSGPMSEAELMTEARTARLPAGEGYFPLFKLLDALPPEVELEYEVAPGSRAEWSPLDKARAARADLDRFIAAYRVHRPPA
ncbi:MAG: sugar phosphate isomerase/epimerase [Pseudomonadota bacterium]|nr:sugar phosphate isomerase/epimerase [Pseudomonadota bacterium]